MLDELQRDGRQAYLVGGHVRDVLLGREPDPTWDVATDVHPDEVTRRFARVVPTGLKHGTVLIVVGTMRVECTTFRRESAYGDARRPDSVEWTNDLREDLARRDLTVNAMAFDPLSGVFEDPFDGLTDLEVGRLRAVGDPRLRFNEDALRPLRVARFTATLDMEPDSATRDAMRIDRERLGSLAAERVREELRTMLRARRPSRGLDLMQETGMLDQWLPELEACVGVEQNRFHAHDVYRHSVLACDAAPQDREVVRWAALLHDIGKPLVRELRNGEATFYRHEVVGADLVRDRLEALRFPNEQRERIVHLVREHMFDYHDAWSDAAIRRWLRRVGTDAVEDLFTLRAADAEATGVSQEPRGDLAELRARIGEVLAADNALTVQGLAVDGADVMRILAIDPGPAVGEVLEGLLEDVIEDPALNERSRLIERLEQAASKRGDA